MMEELDSSELGTQEYWEERYKKEIKNFSTHGDPGEIWFGEDIVDRILRFLEPYDRSASVADVGCGNGMFLIELSKEGYTNLTGLDYSESAIELAKGVAKQYQCNIKYSTCDILCGLSNTFDFIHDKGTYDAICLSEDAKENREKYINSIYNSMNAKSFFIITSCNWTQDELKEHFCEKFELHKVIPTPTFKFGGKEGSVVSICVFKKK